MEYKFAAFVEGINNTVLTVRSSVQVVPVGCRKC